MLKSKIAKIIYFSISKRNGGDYSLIVFFFYRKLNGKLLVSTDLSGIPMTAVE